MGKEPSGTTWNLWAPRPVPRCRPPARGETWPRDSRRRGELPQGLGATTGLHKEPSRGERAAALPEGVSSGSAGDMPPSLLLRRPGAKPGSRTLHRRARPTATPASAGEAASAAQVAGATKGPAAVAPGAFRAPHAGLGASRRTRARRGKDRRALGHHTARTRASFPVPRPVPGAGLAATHARPDSGSQERRGLDPNWRTTWRPGRGTEDLNPLGLWHTLQCCLCLRSI